MSLGNHLIIIAIIIAICNAFLVYQWDSLSHDVHSLRARNEVLAGQNETLNKQQVRLIEQNKQLIEKLLQHDNQDTR